MLSATHPSQSYTGRASLSLNVQIVLQPFKLVSGTSPPPSRLKIKYLFKLQFWVYNCTFIYKNLNSYYILLQSFNKGNKIKTYTVLSKDPFQPQALWHLKLIWTLQIRGFVLSFWSRSTPIKNRFSPANKPISPTVENIL